MIAPRWSYGQEIRHRISMAGCRVRRDSVKFVETLITTSPEFAKAHESEMPEYFERALGFLKERVGEENIFSAVVHMDEKMPHLHLCFVPLTKDGRLSAKEILGNKKRGEAVALLAQLLLEVKSFQAEIQRMQAAVSQSLSMQRCSAEENGALKDELTVERRKSAEQRVKLAVREERYKRAEKLLSKLPRELLKQQTDRRQER